MAASKVELLWPCGLFHQNDGVEGWVHWFKGAWIGMVISVVVVMMTGLMAGVEESG